MKRKGFQTVIVALLTLTVLLSTAQASALTLHKKPYTSGAVSGEVMMAINTSLSTVSAGNSTFTAETLWQEDVGEVNAQSETDSAVRTEVSQIFYDEETGEINEILSARFEEPEYLGKREKLLFSQSGGTPVSYQVGDIKNIVDGVASKTRQLECMVVGEHCTVWGCNNDETTATGLKISLENAQAIAMKFDDVCGSMVDAFGDWLDADGDGKLAVFCYDINQDYTKTSGNIHSGGYHGGYFQESNLVDPVSGNAGNFHFSVKNTSFGMDCIHIDTYPTMGNDKRKLFSEVDKAYPTLFHEMQHLIEQSYRLTGKTYYNGMPTYLNEAFSMAAEHMLFGAENNSLRQRILWFNCASYGAGYYQFGSPLTYFDESTSQVAMHNYSNSYLFGQYIRTRYAQKTGDPTGNTLFRYILEAYHKAYGGDPLQMIVDLLGTTKQELLRDFWAAVYLKEASGVWGFNGEKWAEQIQPTVKPFQTGTSDVIKAGGCIYYTVPNGSAKIASADGNLSFYTFREPQAASVADGKLTVFAEDCPSRIVAAVFDSTGRHLLQTKFLAPSEHGEAAWEDALLRSKEVRIKVLFLDENWQPCLEVIDIENR